MAGFDSAQLKQNLADFAEVSAKEIQSVRLLLNGNKRTLSLLQTSSKSNLVSAINEIFEVANTPVSLEAIEIVVNDYFVLHPQVFEYLQTNESAVWNIVHPLDHLPAVTITDSAGTIWWGEVTYPAPNQVRVAFNFPLSGKATLT